MLKKILLMISLLLVVGCGKEEIKYRNLQVEGDSLNYQLEENDDDYLVPINLVLEKFEIDYLIEGQDISFGDVKLTLGSKIALVASNAKELECEVKEDGQNILVSLDFLVKNLNLTYIEDEQNINIKFVNDLLLDYKEALELFEEELSVTLIDVLTNTEIEVRRVKGGHTTLANVEPKTALETEKLLSLIGGEWTTERRSVVIKIDNQFIAASLSTFPHSGREDQLFGEVVDNRSGDTGSGINLNSISDNNMNGVIDVYFYNSITSLNLIDEEHQEKVIEAAYFYR